MQDETRRLRDKHCAGKAGAPSDYTYVVTGSCRARPGTAAAAAAATNGSSKTDKKKFTPAQNLKELVTVANFLKTEIDVPLQVNSWNYAAIMPLFDKMVSNANRRRHPDPLVRYRTIVQRFMSNMQKSNKSSSTVVSFDTLPRHMVFTLLLSHLQSLDLPSDAPKDVLKYHPFFPSRRG